MRTMMMIMMMISLVMTVSVARATDGKAEDVNVLIRKAFEKEFPSAQFVAWEKVSHEGIYVARFVYNEQPFVSYLDEEGNVLATVRNWDVKNLPIITSESIKRKYGDFTISKVEEMTTPGDLSYLVSLEKAGSRVIVRAYPDGTSYIVKKEKKRKAGF